jgi:hypothetical protein
MAVMDEVQKQMNEMSSKQKEKSEELNSEIRKLKAMIVKHESRIRCGTTLIFVFRYLTTSNVTPPNRDSEKRGQAQIMTRGAVKLFSFLYDTFLGGL